ncbi:hypothetical protein BCR33DRAFT_711471 [Rhizoclosmatium globosum]|uniref:Uncharacterized protein n=1 Tax=Rhizoclosmatium globosum TaxID=329046 RepID=A0A1Y2D1D9_9FUNG|nr:hypothetical protein BCR33DRAFT_711471 [Rhizoclosmatium globosum]|eukprot:ORY53113.1 hypothetical protein BCR33DRAFT_711471 [Rhizoclosmatium globosum]
MDTDAHTATAAEGAASVAQPQQQQPPQQQQQQQQPQPVLDQMPTRSLPAKHPFFKQAGVGAKGSISSPTDQLMSPATQKIEAKRKHLMMNIKPKFLSEKLKESSNGPQ